MFDFLPADEAEKYKPIKSTDWKWTFADYPKEKNGLTVFSCFACGGGSTMGYKLAGCDVVGCCEIDPRMNEIYIKNHNPRHNFLMDIRDFNNIPAADLPPELFDLDILDGSPPCTTFSTAGEREESWGKKKKFREGQAEQTLDDLSFVFIETVAKLRPRVVIMENVEGLLLGEAWKYVQEIYQQLKQAGYQVKHWLCKGENMGIPQTRHRVFFIALRDDVDFDLHTLDMSFNYEPITYGMIKSKKGDEFSERAKAGKLYNLLLQAEPHDKTICDVVVRNGGKPTAFQEKIIHDDDVCVTIRASHSFNAYRWPEMTKTTVQDVINAQTFPQDFDFCRTGKSHISYVCGMSVPPVMIKRIVQRLIESGVFSYKAVMDK